MARQRILRSPSPSPQELRLKLTRAEKEYGAWKKDSAKKVAALTDPRLTAKRRNKLTQKALQRWQSQLDILGQAMALKLECGFPSHVCPV